MKYRAVYTEIVVNEAVFEGPEGLDDAELEPPWWDHLNNDINLDVKRLDVTERVLDSLVRLD